MDDKEIKLSELKNADDVIHYLETQKFKHMKYSHYTNIDAMDSILKNRCLWLSPLEQCNDLLETDWEGDVCNDFCLCFSAVYSENIPMWYLYGGITGQGVRLTFGNSVMNKWKNNFQFALKKYDGDGKEETSEIIQPIDVKVRDVLYISKDETNQKYRLKYNNQCNNGKFSEYDYKQIREKYRGFYKELPWFYEKEFRVLIEVEPRISNLVKDDSCYKIALVINNDVYKEAQILLGPESNISNLEQYQGIKQFLLEAVPRSQYTNKIKMDLLKKNKRGIILHKEEWCKKKEWEEIYKYAHDQKWC